MKPFKIHSAIKFAIIQIILCHGRFFRVARGVAVAYNISFLVAPVTEAASVVADFEVGAPSEIPGNETAPRMDLPVAIQVATLISPTSVLPLFSPPIEQPRVPRNFSSLSPPRINCCQQPFQWTSFHITAELFSVVASLTVLFAGVLCAIIASQPVGLMIAGTGCGAVVCQIVLIACRSDFFRARFC